MQKKTVCVFVVVLVILFGVAEGATPQLPFSLVVHERFGSIAVGDLNTTLMSYNSGYDQIRAQNVLWAVVGEIRPIPSRFTDWEAELQWRFWWGFSIGIAVSEPTHYSGTSFLTFSIMNNALNQTINNTYASTIRVSPPLMLTLYKSVNLIRNVSASIDGGIGLYRAQMTQTYLYQARYPLEDATVGTFYFDVQGKRMGYHLGLSLEYRFNKRFSMSAEGQWRFAQINTFRGIATLEAQEFDAGGNLSGVISHSRTGILYHLMGQDFHNGEFIEKLLVTDLVPPFGGADMPYDIRQAFLDLGCFTLKVGLRIGLF